MTETRIEVGRVEDFPEGSVTPVTAGTHAVALVRQDGEFFALHDRCTHANFPMHDGELLEGKLKCVQHGATFDLRSGRPTLPAVKKIRLYDTAVEDGRVYVVVQEA